MYHHGEKVLRTATFQFQKVSNTFKEEIRMRIRVIASLEIVEDIEQNHLRVNNI